jgi:hypothetical protein
MQRRYLMKSSSGICSKQIRKPGSLTVFTIVAVSNSVMMMISRRLMGQCTSLYANSCSTIFGFFSIVCLQLKCNYRFIRTFSRVYPTFDKEVLHARRVWRYQRGNQNPYIEEEKCEWVSEYNLHFEGMMMMSSLYKTTLSWIFIMQSHWQNSPLSFRTIRTYFPDSERTGICSYSLMVYTLYFIYVSIVLVIYLYKSQWHLANI